MHTTKDGMENFYRWAELYKVKVPKKCGEGMKRAQLCRKLCSISAEAAHNVKPTRRTHALTHRNIHLRLRNMNYIETQ